MPIHILVTLPPPLALAKAFSRSGCGRIFPVFSRVMREGLSTGLGARMAGSGLSKPIFSGPDDDSVPPNGVRVPSLGEVRVDQDATAGSLTVGLSVTRARVSRLM